MNSHVIVLCCMHIVILSAAAVMIAEYNNYFREVMPNVEFFESLLLEMGDEFPFNDLSLYINPREQVVDPNGVSIHWQVEHSFFASAASATLADKCSSAGWSVVEGYMLCYLPEQALQYYDIVVEYSMPNIQHVTASAYHSQQFLQRILYIPPIAFVYTPRGNTTCNNNGIRDIQFLSLFSAHTYAEGTRRKAVMDTLNTMVVNMTTVNDKFTMDEVQELFSRSAIVLNIHQSEGSRTIEEFRILPALLMGAVVVSEDGPLLEHIPYRDYVIFSTEADFAATVVNVSSHYEHYYDKIHGPGSGLREVVQEMVVKAQLDTERVLLRALCSKTESTLRRSNFFGCDLD